jgi:hypothetical protein
LRFLPVVDVWVSWKSGLLFSAWGVQVGVSVCRGFQPYLELLERFFLHFNTAKGMEPEAEHCEQKLATGDADVVHCVIRRKCMVRQRDLSDLNDSNVPRQHSAVTFEDSR